LNNSAHKIIQITDCFKNHQQIYIVSEDSIEEHQDFIEQLKAKNVTGIWKRRKVLNYFYKMKEKLLTEVK